MLLMKIERGSGGLRLESGGLVATAAGKRKR
jgi:hypothetical protein